MLKTFVPQAELVSSTSLLRSWLCTSFGVCEFTGLECENGVLEWNTGVEYWSVQTDFLEANVANISRSTLGLNTTFNIVYRYTICFGVHDKLCLYNTSTAHACVCISFSFYSLFMDDNSIQVLIK